MPASTPSPFHRVPILHHVDLLVVGAGSGVVASAVEAQQRGARVLAVSDRSYFGDESAGALRLEVEPFDDPLSDAWRPEDGSRLPLPGAVKRRLERALLDRNIPFLYYTRPVALLRDRDANLHGVVLASRTSLYAVTCRAVVDATRHGLVAQLSGIPIPERREPKPKLDLVVLSPDAPASASFRTATQPVPFSMTTAKGERIEAVAHRVTLPRPEVEASTASHAGLEHRLRAQLTHPTLWGIAETLPTHTPKHLSADALADSPLGLPETTYEPAPNLFVMNGLLPLSAGGLARLEEPAVQVALGRRLAAAAICRLQTSAQPFERAELRIDTGPGGVGGTFGFAPSFVRPGAAGPELALAIDRFPLLGECDVVIAGGGTGGAPAGIAAARAGARTVVLEVQHGLGGVGTLGLIACYWHGNRVGFTSEIDDGVLDLMNVGKDENRSRWNPHVKDVWLQRTLLDAGASAWLGSFAFGVQLDGQQVSGVLVSTPYASGLLRTRAVVDATGNADIAAAAGAPCRVTDHTHVAVQGTGLSPVQPGVGYRNTDHTFVDDCDVVGTTHAFVNARAKFPHEFDVSPLVDTRERRQIHGEIELSPLDFLAERTFPDTITTAMSNFDSHGFTVHPVFMAVPPDKKPMYAHVPFRSMLPRGVEGVLVTGLGMSAHRDALPVVRMQADVQNQGYAAGAAAAISAASSRPFRALPIRDLQRRLVDVGILNPEVLAHDDSFPLPANVIREAVQTGPVDHFNAAVLIAHPEQSLPGLRSVLANDADPARREQAALILGLFGDRAAAPLLGRIVAEEPWDDGWNFTGMHQFGRSMSRLDALVMALGKTRDPLGIDPIRQKIQALDAVAAFSHCRAVSTAAAALAEPCLASALARLLSLPGVRGHAHLASRDVIHHANNDHIETAARNLSLRELILARGLYLCGDVDGLGQSVLQTYAKDLRGQYARHAQAILAAPDLAAVRASVY